jgi:hypothetical protein
LNKRLGTRVASLFALLALPALLRAEDHPVKHKRDTFVDVGSLGQTADESQLKIPESIWAKPRGARLAPSRSIFEANRLAGQKDIDTRENWQETALRDS